MPKLIILNSKTHAKSVDIELMPNEKIDFFSSESDPFGEYLITNFGRAFSLKKNKFIKPRLNNQNYPRIDVQHFINNQRVYRKQVFLHIEVVKVFGDCYGKTIKKLASKIDILNIDHINKDREDCKQSNLQIVSAKENQRRKLFTPEQREEFLKNHYSKMLDVDIEDIF